jgi:putative hydrolase of the HAD superfamily
VSDRAPVNDRAQPVNDRAQPVNDRAQPVNDRARPVSRFEAVICDFGGVLTSPLEDSFTAFQESSGISLKALGAAMSAVAARDGALPLFELETGRMTEAQFLRSLSAELTAQLGRKVELSGFGERYFEHLLPNEPMIEYMRDLKARGYKIAICTNNVREWEPLWRAKLPVDEIFDVVVDSAFVGTRKPEHRIYEITLERLGAHASAALFLDDVELNCAGAREVGLTAVWFQDTDQAIAEMEAALASGFTGGS